MDKKEKLEKLTAEKEYYNVEFLEKQKQNKKSFAEKIFLDFVKEFDKSEFLINQQDKKVEISGIINEYSIDLITDIDSNPKEPVIFIISKSEKESKKSIDFFMRPYNDSPLPKPDFNRLRENPYKGMDLLDIEIVEQQKNIDFLKKYITDTMNFDDYIFSCEKKLSGESLGEFDTIKDLMKQIR